MNCKTAPNVKELIEKYGVNNLVFVMDVDCFDEYGVAMGAMNGAGLIEPGQNTRRVAMVARERFHLLDENYKIELQGHDTDDLTIPFQTYHISSFEGLIRSGYVNIYVDTLDGFMPVFQCIDECFTPKEAKVIHQVQKQFLPSHNPSVNGGLRHGSRLHHFA